jgi:hypothetical protein
MPRTGVQTAYVCTSKMVCMSRTRSRVKREKQAIHAAADTSSTAYDFHCRKDMRRTLKAQLHAMGGPGSKGVGGTSNFHERAEHRSWRTEVRQLDRLSEGALWRSSLAVRLTFVERLISDLRGMLLCQLTQVCNEVTLVLLLLRRGLGFDGGMNKTERNGTRDSTRKAARETRERTHRSYCGFCCEHL